MSLRIWTLMMASKIGVQVFYGFRNHCMKWGCPAKTRIIFTVSKYIRFSPTPWMFEICFSVVLAQFSFRFFQIFLRDIGRQGTDFPPNELLPVALLEICWETMIRILQWRVSQYQYSMIINSSMTIQWLIFQFQGLQWIHSYVP